MKYSIDTLNKKLPYIALEDYIYYSSRYSKTVHINKSMPSDGATKVVDIISIGWWVHDKLCETGTFSDGTKCNNWQASTILYDILRSEGYWFRARTWWLGSLLFGGGKCRNNKIFP